MAAGLVDPIAASVRASASHTPPCRATMSPTKPTLDFPINITQHEALATVRDADQQLDDRIVQKPLPSGPQVGTVRRAHADCVSDRVKWQRRSATCLCITDTAVVCGSVLLGQYVRFGQTTDPSG